MKTDIGCLPGTGMIRSTFFAVVLCGFFAVASRASADIFSTTGAMTPISPPPSLLVGALESSTSIAILDEGAKFSPIVVTLDVSGPGTFDASPGTPAFLPAGTFVHTYLVHFDPIGSSFATATGAVFFDPGEFIVGIQILPASLDMSQVPPIPHPTPTYPAGLPTRGLEFLPGTDTVTIAPGLGSASFTFFAELGVDQARIFTIPEPSAFVMLAASGALLLGIWSRRRLR